MNNNHIKPPVTTQSDFQAVLSVLCSQLENRWRLQQTWDDFNSNGVDCGPYDSYDEEPKAEAKGEAKKKRVKNFCSFCKNIGRPKSVYKSHVVQNCANLAAHVCPTCNNKGHTPNYCPLKKQDE